MKEYTYNDLLAMQEDAKQRVMEMQKKSKYAVEDMNRVFLQNTENENTYEQTEKRNAFSRHSVPVAQQPRNIQYPTGIVSTENEKAKNCYEQNTDNKSRVQKNYEQNNPISKFFNIFGKLNREESEKMLILALCVLLSNEQADENLIIALLYLIS